MDIIKAINLKKYYTSDTYEVRALDGVSLTVEEGEFIAVVGTSGCGKTTLMNILGGLDIPDFGGVWIRNTSLKDLNKEERTIFRRRNIGFVFQQYNLIPSLSIRENIVLPMRLDGKEIDIDFFNEIVEILGLKDKLERFPSTLSGGQQQRVAIARALASNPKILLCDEATSALDPQTTASILELLESINKRFGITIVIITHQMSVIREICSHVAIIEHGVLVEDGLVEDIFSHPKSKAAKELILRDQPGNNNAPLANAVQERMQGDKKIRIVFSENSAFEPVIANMILQFKTPVNILRADTKNVGGVAKGEMILGLPEDRHLQVDIEEYLKEKGLAVEEVTEDVE